MSELDGGPDPSRREALKRIAAGAGAITNLPILGQRIQARTKGPPAPSPSGASISPIPDPSWKPIFFDEHQNQLVIALTELIIPETDTPGAKAALVNRYLDLLLNEEAAARQKSFIEGVAWIDARSLELYGKSFVQAAIQQQVELLTVLADPDNKNPRDRRGVDFFQEIKDLTIFAYYTSQVGMERELEYGGDSYCAEFPGACTHPEHQT
jgi:hypothetical protein